MNIRAKISLRRYTHALLTLCSAERGNEYLILNSRITFSRRKLFKLFREMGIKNRDDFTKDIYASFRGGPRQEFSHLTSTLAALSEAERNAYISSATNDERLIYKLRIANDYLWRLPTAGIAAHDYTWVIFKCWAGCKLGYLTAEQKRKYLGEIIPLIQQSYSNWKEYMMGYYVGRAFNSITLSDDFVGQNQSILSKLLISRHSPLHRIEFRP
jgi:hypothetical protein